MHRTSSVPRLKGAALRQVVRAREAAAGFPRWRAAVAASKARPALPYLVECYRWNRANFMPARYALLDAREHAANRERLYGPAMYAATLNRHAQVSA